jgi:hypothetical protein
MNWEGCEWKQLLPSFDVLSEHVPREIESNPEENRNSQDRPWEQYAFVVELVI